MPLTSTVSAFASQRQLSQGPWSCVHCTFDNTRGSQCEMCGSSRPVLVRQRSAVKSQNSDCPICMERVPEGEGGLQLDKCNHGIW